MKQNSTMYGWVATLLCILFFQLSNAQTVTVSDPTPGAPADYTFNYTLATDLPGIAPPTGFNYLFDFVFADTAPVGGYPTALPQELGLTSSNFKVWRNGVLLTNATDYTVSLSTNTDSDFSRVRIQTNVDLVAGDELQVEISGAYSNPIGLGAYTFDFRTYSLTLAGENTIDSFQATFVNATNTVYMADTTVDALTDYTFLYTTVSDVVTANGDRLFSLNKDDIAPAVYADFQTPGNPLTATNVVVTLNGAELTAGTDYDANVSASQIYIDALIDVPAGSILKVELKQLITNPSNVGEYNVSFQTSTSSETPIDAFQDAVYVGSIVEVSDASTDVMADYTFKYQITTEVSPVANIRLFNIYLDDIAPANYPNFDKTNYEINVKVNGVPLVNNEDYTTAISNNSDQIGVNTKKQLLPVGTKFEVEIKQAIVNPAISGDYTFNFGTAYLSFSDFKYYDIESFAGTVMIVKAPTVTVADPTLGALTDYTFHYTTETELQLSAGKRLFELKRANITPAGKYIAWPSDITSALPIENLVVKLNGVDLISGTDYNGYVNSNEIYVTMLSEDYPAGSEFEVQVKGLITNPSESGEYNFTFVTSEFILPPIPPITTVFDTFQASVTIGTLSSIDFEEGKFKFYPNPVKDVLHVQAPVVIKNVVVYNVVGQEVYNVSPNAMESTINLASQARGVYLVKLVSENNNTKTIKVIKN
ncbi:T9SS type A sorting domain-containing protein [Gaetbulibacter saemankumensis]|uniref:T9SS type A sorting domain-containing protein n=1 Tax=Gaetbulibacter saemankumensis TaxID=311208 RepID=UPI000484A47A|nr:T9SS type A sorting domain-containing protein [Gaetbulibacter saemankumensis]